MFMNSASGFFGGICLQSWYFKIFMEAMNQIQGIDSVSLCSLAVRYDNIIPTRFRAPLDGSKILAQLSATSSSPLPLCMDIVLEFLNNLWGLGTE